MTGTSSALEALDVRLPAPGWAVLDAVRTRAFTGELTLIGAPPVRLWADRGRIYLADLLDAPPLPARLLAAGVLSYGELARGVVRVGEREHLGALFERAPGADRHAVQLAVAEITEAALRLIAAQHLAAAEMIPYAFDPSGVHAWGAPTEPGAPPAGAATAPGEGFAAPPADARPAPGPELPFPAPSATAAGRTTVAAAGQRVPAGAATATATPDLDWERLPYLERLAEERDGRASESFSVIWPDGDVERRSGVHGAVGTNGAAADGQSPISGVPVGTRTRLLDDRFGAL